jgi:hypothetical protein
MVDLAMLQVVRDLVAIFGVLAGFTYYVITVRNANKVRKTQLALQLSDKLRDLEATKIDIELYEMEWIDFDDFLRKYDSTVNPDNFAKRNLIWSLFQELGYMLYQNLVDRETVYNLLQGPRSILHWTKFESIIMAQRERYNDPHWYRWFEYLATEISNERASQGLSDIVDADGVTTR